MSEQVENKLVQEQTELHVVVTDVPLEAEKIPNQEQDEVKKQSLLVPEAESMPVHSNSLSPEHEHEHEHEEENAPHQAVEERTKSSHLPENEKQALQELKQLVQDALNKHEFDISSSTQKEIEQIEPDTEKGSVLDPSLQLTANTTIFEEDGAKTLEAIEETIVSSTRSNPTKEKPDEPVPLFIWGVKLFEDEKTDVILLKFLQARDFKVKEAFTMMKNTIQWRNDFKIDHLLEEDLGCSELERTVFMNGYSKEGHPVCYNVYGEFQNKELYQNMFSDEEKRQRFLKWRVQFLEKSIRKLDFGPDGVSTIVQVNDLKNSPGPNKWELRQATKQGLQLLQDNYPEFVAKQVFINVPWWFLALNKMISPFLSERTKSKFVVAGPSKSTETLLKYICAEQIPERYGGLSRDGDFGTGDCVTEVIVKPSAKSIVEFPVTEACDLSWEARVVGWEVSYGAEFVPSAENAYTIIIQKMRRIGSNQEQVISTSYKVDEPGKVVLTISNLSSKKKKLLYRFKTKLIC
ncbi:hypothetical protein RD792_001306 [Penstemon davidsonii]|uniref:Patellin-3 n=1 Tax=Penstemon davidsonii TaxID=160366 RepID=A0ABR0DP78_9LAMI|nr:hypothetical protein RD792_001306 [Penstemon davidsonii]